MGLPVRVSEDDYEAVMFQSEEQMPEFLGTTWEEHKSAWVSVSLVAQREHWRLASIAHSLQKQFGPDSLKKFGEEMGLKASTIYHYARTYRRFLHPDCQRWQTLHFSVHMIAASQKTPEDTMALLEKADAGGWSAERTREYVRREVFKKQIPDAINPDDEYDRHVWEREARPSLYRFIQKCPKFKRQVMYVIDEIDGWFKTRTMAPVEMIAQKLQEGCETVEQIAEEMHMNVGPVQLLLDELLSQGRVREEKELKVTKDARGATRTRYLWVYPPDDVIMGPTMGMVIGDDEDDDV